MAAVELPFSGTEDFQGGDEIGELARIQQEIGVLGAAVSGLDAGEGLVDEHARGTEGGTQGRKQRTVKVVDHYDGFVDFAPEVHVTTLEVQVARGYRETPGLRLRLHES